VLSDPERAVEVFERAKLMYTESDLLVVQVSDARQPILHICKTLLAAEINIHYVYPLLVGPHGAPSLAIHVDNHELAASTLAAKGYVIVTESDLNDPTEY
jgi:hypothetical protein